MTDALTSNFIEEKMDCPAPGCKRGIINLGMDEEDYCKVCDGTGSVHNPEWNWAEVE